MSAAELLAELWNQPPYILAAIAGIAIGNILLTRPVEKTIDRVMTLATMAKFRARDQQRTFNGYQKAILAKRAGGRCEHKHPLWIRCVRPGEHADHVVPWSKGGPTAASNGQWLCRRHNLRKSALYPSPVYRWRLGRRRARAARRRTT